MKTAIVTEIHCTYDPETKGGNRLDWTKGKGNDPLGILQQTAVPAEIRLYENIVDEEKGVYNEDGSLNLKSKFSDGFERTVMWSRALAEAEAYDSFQFVRQGYFCADAKDSTPEHPVFNRIVSLKELI